MIVKDTSTNEIVTIIRENPRWRDTDGQTHTWDFEVMSSSGLYFVDKCDIEFLGK